MSLRYAKRQLVMAAAGLLLAAPVMAQVAPVISQPTPWLGITFSSSGQGAGARVLEVHHGAPADEAGIKPGDTIMAIDGAELVTAGMLPRLIDGHAVGDGLALTVARGRRMLTVRAVLAPRLRDQELLSGRLLGRAAPAVTMTVADHPEVSTTESAASRVTVMAWFSLSCDGCAVILDEVAAVARGWNPGEVTVSAVISAEPADVTAWRSQGGTSLPILIETVADSTALGTYTLDAGRSSVTLVAVDSRGVVRAASILETAASREVRAAVLADAALVIERLFERQPRR